MNVSLTRSGLKRSSRNENFSGCCSASLKKMKNINHTVLALKYRPQTFGELIGQEVMVQTITNSIKQNKLPNAYLLTGIRGVGKTTTARIIAKAINCKEDFINKKSSEYCNCSSCEEISKSKHLDVLEMDAASRTGIDDVRELIDSSGYSPTSAKYKIFIIDEVHMLSKQAFNGLLKTLEEPPSHLKFIFATTEVKKIPVTIISRCQRFDLHRISIQKLQENLERISKIENGKISKNALKIIAKAAEGSVRDSLSLLDRALVSKPNQSEEIDENFIRKMLGIADRTKILELFKAIFNGEQKTSISILRNMIDEGVEPVALLNDFLEIIYYMIRKKNLGDFESDISISENEISLINSIADNIDIKTLTIFWQFLLKGIEEMSIVSNQILSLEMIIFRLLHLKEMPDYQEVLNLISNVNSNDSSQIQTSKIPTKSYLNFEKETKMSIEQIKNVIQTKPDSEQIKSHSEINKSTVVSVKTFGDLIDLVSKNKEPELKYDLERNVRLVKFSEGKIDISLNDQLGKNFIRNLSEKLYKWTGKRWVISLTQEMGKKTYAELNLKNKEDLLEKEKKSELYKNFIKNFPDAELKEIIKKDKK